MNGYQVFELGQLTRAAEHSKPPPRPSECPRCGSTNTKFCYYNNYNKSQPRHFCKTCKRHWTKGGTLRSIPSGRRRTNKRPAAATEVPPEPQPPRKNKIQKLLSFSTEQKNMSNILYQALIQSSSPSTDCINFIVPHGTILERNGTTHAAGLDDSAHQNHPNTELTFSSYYKSSNDSAEESTVTTSAAPPWTASNLGAAADVADLWNWNDQIDSLAGSTDFNLVWDHLNFDF